MALFVATLVVCLSPSLVRFPAGRSVALHPTDARVVLPQLAASDASSRRKARRAQKRAERDGTEAAAPDAAAAAAATPVGQREVDSTDAPLVIDEPLIENSVGVPLPSFDDFRRRDEELAAPESPAERRAKAATRTPDAEKSAQEKLMDILSFDEIDERPVYEDEYDATARIIGRGLPNKAGAYVLPYLQTGHSLLLIVLLISSLISYPGFPLTEVPDEYRALLLRGLGLTYLINAAAAAYSIGIAQKKGEPVGFWVTKVFLLGGLALGELSEAVPDRKAKANRR